MQGFFLGLANGTTCLAFCAPVLIPLLLNEGNDVPHNLVTLIKFLGGRLGGYLLFGLLAWAMGGRLMGAGSYQAALLGAAYVGLSVLLLAAVLRKKPSISSACVLKGSQTRLNRWPALLPVGMGLLAGLKVCPPSLLAFTDAASSGTLGGSLFLFLMFFLGTCIYFLPISLLGAFARFPDLQLVGKFAAVIVALYYLASGVLLFSGGARL